MSTLATEIEISFARDVTVTNTALVVDLDDGRSISVPLAWYPRLAYGSEDERKEWRLIGGGSGIHWESLDEDLSIEGIIAGRRSCESQQSLKRWIDSRS